MCLAWVFHPATMIFRVNQKLDFLIHLDGERAHLLIRSTQKCGGKGKGIGLCKTKFVPFIINYIWPVRIFWHVQDEHGLKFVWISFFFKLFSFMRLTGLPLAVHCCFLRSISFSTIIFAFSLNQTSFPHFQLKGSNVKDCCFRAGSYSDLNN